MHIVNTYIRNVPSQVETAVHMAVLVSGAPYHKETDFACYEGIVKMPDTDATRAQAAEWVAHSGRKMNFSEASKMFTGLKENQYRR